MNVQFSSRLHRWSSMVQPPPALITAIAIALNGLRRAEIISRTMNAMCCKREAVFPSIFFAFFVYVRNGVIWWVKFEEEKNDDGRKGR